MRDERRTLFNWKKKKAPSASATAWTQRFVCLCSTIADRVPSTQSEKLILEEAGLGEKLVVIPDLDCSPERFHQVLLDAYPKLGFGGGFELLRCRPKSRDLLLISSRISNTPRLLKRRVGNGRVYIRPIQRDLSLEPESCGEEVEEVSWTLHSLIIHLAMHY